MPFVPYNYSRLSYAIPALSSAVTNLPNKSLIRTDSWNSMTFQDLKIKFLNSMTFQDLHGLYEPYEVTKGFLDKQFEGHWTKVPVAPSKGIQDYLGIWTPGTGVRILCQWNLDSLEGFRIPWAVFWIPKHRILNSKAQDSGFQSTGFHKQKFPRFWNLNFLNLHEAIPGFSIFVQCICTYFSWQVLNIKNILATLSTTGSVVQPSSSISWGLAMTYENKFWIKLKLLFPRL